MSQILRTARLAYWSLIGFATGLMLGVLAWGPGP